MANTPKKELFPNLNARYVRVPLPESRKRNREPISGIVRGPFRDSTHLVLKFLLRFSASNTLTDMGRGKEGAKRLYDRIAQFRPSRPGRTRLVKPERAFLIALQAYRDARIPEKHLMQFYIVLTDLLLAEVNTGFYEWLPMQQATVLRSRKRGGPRVLNRYGEALAMFCHRGALHYFAQFSKEGGALSLFRDPARPKSDELQRVATDCHVSVSAIRKARLGQPRHAAEEFIANRFGISRETVRRLRARGLPNEILDNYLVRALQEVKRPWPDPEDQSFWPRSRRIQVPIPPPDQQS